MVDDQMVPNIPPRELMLLDPRINIVRDTISIAMKTCLGPCTVIQLADSKSGQGTLLQINSGEYGQALVKILETITEIPRLMQLYKGLGLSEKVIQNHRWTEECRNKEREIAFASQLVHPYITKILAFISPSGKTEDINAIIMEGPSLGTLENFAKKTKKDHSFLIRTLESMANNWQMLSDIVMRTCRLFIGIIYVYNNGQTIKLGNFGYAREENGEDKTANKGDQPYYKAPEIICNAPLASYSFPVDVYSFGLVLWSISHRGIRPFWDTGNRFALQTTFRDFLQASDSNRPPIRDDLDPFLVDVIRSCWVTGANERPAMSEVLARLG